MLDNTDTPNETPDAAQALAAIQASRRAVYERVDTQGWRYDLTYAALCAGMVAAQGLDQPLSIVFITLGVLGLTGMFQAEAKRTGVRVTGVSPKQARWIAIAIGMVIAAIMLGMVWLKHSENPPAMLPIMAAAGVVSFVVALAGSRLWRRYYRSEMRGAK